MRVHRRLQPLFRHLVRILRLRVGIFTEPNAMPEGMAMNIAQARPRRWSPHVVLFAVVLHAVILYYVASTFHIVPPLIETPLDPPTIQAVRLDPPPPIEKPEPLDQNPSYGVKDKTIL